MEEVLNDVQSHEMNSEDNKAFLEEKKKKKKRFIKTNAQLQVLEKLYNEHKYPTACIKAQLAQSIGLTEKQVSEWFLHRRSKDKSLMNAENYVIKKHDLSSGVIQDHVSGSGHRQVSGGSIKHGQNSNLNNASLGSGSTLRDMSNHQKNEPSDVATSGYIVPKLHMDVIKTRPIRSGYLKVKGQHETTAITAVMRQLGKYYREDGPPLAVGFDLLPPCAFESSLQNPVIETCYDEEDEEASADFSNKNQLPNFSKGYEYSNSIMASYDSNMDRARFSNYINPMLKRNNASLSNSGAYGQRMDPFLPLDEVSGRDIMMYRYGIEGKRMTSVQPFGENLNREKESTFRMYNDVGRNISKGDNIKDVHNSFERVHHRESTAKDGRTYAERSARMTNENQDHQRMRNEFPRSYT